MLGFTALLHLVKLIQAEHSARKWNECGRHAPSLRLELSWTHEIAERKKPIAFAYPTKLLVMYRNDDITNNLNTRYQEIGWCRFFLHVTDWLKQPWVLRTFNLIGHVLPKKACLWWRLNSLECAVTGDIFSSSPWSEPFHTHWMTWALCCWTSTSTRQLPCWPSWDCPPCPWDISMIKPSVVIYDSDLMICQIVDSRGQLGYLQSHVR